MNNRLQPWIAMILIGMMFVPALMVAGEKNTSNEGGRAANHVDFTDKYMAAKVSMYLNTVDESCWYDVAAFQDKVYFKAQVYGQNRYSLFMYNPLDGLSANIIALYNFSYPVCAIGVAKNVLWISTMGSLFTWDGTSLINKTAGSPFDENSHAKAMMEFDDSVFFGTNDGKIYKYKNDFYTLVYQSPINTDIVDMKVWNNTLFVGGSNTYPYELDAPLLWSNDGINWNVKTWPFYRADGLLPAGKYLYLNPINSPYGASSEIYRTDDGVNWVSIAAANGQRKCPTAVLYYNGVAYSFNSDNNINYIDVIEEEGTHSIMTIDESNKIIGGVAVINNVIYVTWGSHPAIDPTDGALYRIGPYQPGEHQYIYVQSGYVYLTGTSTAISEAKITIFPDDYTVTTDLSGHYSFNVTDGTYTISISATGYQPLSATVNITGADNEQDFYLTNNAKPIPGIFLPINAPKNATVGSNIIIQLTVQNNGTTSPEGDVTIQFPDLTGIAGSQITGWNGTPTQKKIVNIGDKIYKNYGSGQQINAIYPLVVAWETPWNSGMSRNIEVQLPMQKEGQFRVYAKFTMDPGDTMPWIGNPTTNTTGSIKDQQEEYSYAVTIDVKKPSGGQDIEPPTVKITSPIDGSKIVAGSVQITGTAKDNKNVSKVEVKIDEGTWQITIGTTSWSISLPLSGSNKIITAKATDSSGNIATVSININVTEGGVPSGSPAQQTANFRYGLDALIISSQLEFVATGSKKVVYPNQNSKAEFDIQPRDTSVTLNVPGVGSTKISLGAAILGTNSLPLPDLSTDTPFGKIGVYLDITGRLEGTTWVDGPASVPSSTLTWSSAGKQSVPVTIQPNIKPGTTINIHLTLKYIIAIGFHYEDPLTGVTTILSPQNIGSLPGNNKQYVTSTIQINSRPATSSFSDMLHTYQIPLLIMSIIIISVVVAVGASRRRSKQRKSTDFPENKSIPQVETASSSPIKSDMDKDGQATQSARSPPYTNYTPVPQPMQYQPLGQSYQPYMVYKCQSCGAPLAINQINGRWWCPNCRRVY